MLKRKIRAAAKKIAEKIHPEKIILFGSYAYGKPNSDSDVDFLVIMRSKLRPVERARRISTIFNPYPFPMDILVRTPQEIRKRISMGDFFIQEIIEKGVVLYEK